MITEAVVIRRILNLAFYILMAYALIFIPEIACSFTLELPMLGNHGEHYLDSKKSVHGILREKLERWQILL